jgi:hypothetical protein
VCAEGTARTNPRLRSEIAQAGGYSTQRYRASSSAAIGNSAGFPPKIGGILLALAWGMATESRLRHLDAAKVETPVGSLDHIPVLSPTTGSLGELEGIIIDPNDRHVRYYVVESRRWLKTHRYLLPDVPMRLDPDCKALHVDVERDDLSTFAELDDEEFPPFSDDDLITTMFAGR